LGREKRPSPFPRNPIYVGGFVKLLGDVVASFQNRDIEIIAAIDLLISGI